MFKDTLLDDWGVSSWDNHHDSAADTNLIDSQIHHTSFSPSSFSSSPGTLPPPPPPSFLFAHCFAHLLMLIYLRCSCRFIYFCHRRQRRRQRRLYFKSLDYHQRCISNSFKQLRRRSLPLHCWYVTTTFTHSHLFSFHTPFLHMLISLRSSRLNPHPQPSPPPRHPFWLIRFAHD